MKSPANTTISRLDAVDGLRGVAALTIVIYHLYANALSPELRVLGVNVLRPLHDGWSGVNLFLVLSGFCLYWPYAQPVARPTALKSFFVKRIRRIVPAYYASLTLVPASYWLGSKIGVPRPEYNPFNIAQNFPDVFLHLTLLHSLTPSSILSWNGVTWSLGLEWTWYLVFPIAIYAARRWGIGRIVIAATVLTVCYRVSAYLLIHRSHGQGIDVDGNTIFCVRSFVLGRLFEFAVGMLVAHVAAWKQVTLAAARASILAAGFALAIAHVATPVDPILPVRDILYGLGYGAMLLAAVAPGGYVGKVLASSPLVAVGELSYSLYLLHMPIVGAGLAGLGAAGLLGLPLFFVSLLLILPSIAIAWLSYKAFEEPFLYSRKKQAALKLRDASAIAIAP